MFLAPRRFFFDRAAEVMPMWAYHFREFLPGDPIVDGGVYFFFFLLTSLA